MTIRSALTVSAILREMRRRGADLPAGGEAVRRVLVPVLRRCLVLVRLLCFVVVLSLRGRLLLVFVAVVIASS